jgi:hypothetical protein
MAKILLQGNILKIFRYRFYIFKFRARYYSGYQSFYFKDEIKVFQIELTFYFSEATKPDECILIMKLIRKCKSLYEVESSVWFGM